MDEHSDKLIPMKVTKRGEHEAQAREGATILVPAKLAKMYEDCGVAVPVKH